MAKITRQFKILLWKCLILYKKHWISTLFEIILPIFLSLLFVIANSKLNTVKTQSSNLKPATSFPLSLWNNRLCHLEKIFYAPNDHDEMNIIISEMNNILNNLNCSVIFYGFKDEKLLIDDFLNRKNRLIDKTKAESWYGFVLKKFSQENIRYKIKADMGYLPLFPHKFNSKPYMNVLLSNYSGTQTYINQALLNIIANRSASSLNSNINDQNDSNMYLEFFRYPYPEYVLTKFSLIFIIFGDVITSGFIIFFPIMVKRLADEKSNYIREIFKISGLSDWIYWLSNFLNFFSLFLIEALILVYLYFWKINGQALFNYSNFIIIYFGFLCYGAQLILSAMAFSILFNRPIFAVCASLIFYVVQNIPSYFLYIDNSYNNNNPNFVTFHRVISSILPNNALKLWIKLIETQEKFGKGVVFSNIFEPVANYAPLSYALCCIIMILSSLFYCILIWYLEAVWPFQYGVPKNFYFLFQKSYWFPQSNKMTPQIDKLINLINLNEKFFERTTLSEISGISIISLTHKYNIFKPQKLAIDNLSLNIPFDQITVLLGHNGAGKTTLMNIITGTITPTSGTIYINGHDIRTQTNLARSSMSFCPQYDVLYSELTVREHLQLFAGIRNMNEPKTYIQEIAKSVKLFDELDKTASSLSGGMRRKLCLANALIGNVKILILDEPTSGLDPDSRREIWDTLQNLKKGRTILITTHHMEEADAIGDKIAIIGSGQLKCFGSTLFLKRAFGTGYKIRIAKQVNKFKAEKLESLIKDYFPNAQLTNQIETEDIYSLHDQEIINYDERNSKYAMFFDYLENNKDNLGLLSWGISITTLEDVFLKVDALDLSKNVKITEAIDTHEVLLDFKQEDMESIEVKKLSGMSLAFQCMKALFYKRFNHLKRNWILELTKLLIPALVFVLILYLDQSILNDDPDTTPILLNLGNMYGTTFSFYKSNSSNDKKFGLYYYKNVLEENYANVEFLNSSVDINEYLLKQSRTISLNQYINDYIIGMAKYKNQYQLWFNNEASYALPLSVNSFFEAKIREINTSSKKFKLELLYHPFPGSYTEMNYIFIKIKTLIWRLILPISVSYLAASFVLNPIHEKATKAKLLQFMTGLNPLIYWSVNILFDFICYICYCIPIYFVIYIYDIKSIFFGQWESLFASILLFLSFGISTQALAYCLSLVTSHPIGSYFFLYNLYLLFGVILSIIDMVIEILVPDVLSKSVYNNLNLFWNIFSIYSFNKAISKIYESSLEKSLCDRIDEEISILKCCEDYEDKQDCIGWKDPLTYDKNGVLTEVVIMLITAILLLIIVFWSEYFCKKITFHLSKIYGNRNGQFNYSFQNETKNDICVQNLEDDDVANEREYVHSIVKKQCFDEEAMVISNLKKNYGSFESVKGIDFTIHKRECFGLLGANGAGKTSTFRCLIGDIQASSGNAFIGEKSLRKNLNDFQTLIGYCPQFDGLIDNLSGEEILYLFGRLRGISKNQLDKEVSSLINIIGIKEHAKKSVKTYSGGNKRKLSFGIAIIGNPPLLFLDEPTSGVDPASRRKMWSILSYLRKNKDCSIVLTSHSMEECEALCSRIAIMVSGKLECIGSLQHLRKKFGSGSSLYIKMDKNIIHKNYEQSLINAISKNISSSVLKNKFQYNLEFRIMDKNLKWSYLFKVMDKIKKQFKLEDYILCDTSLEQIFISFSKKQLNDNYLNLEN